MAKPLVKFPKLDPHLVVTDTRNLRCKFTEPETLAIGKQLAEFNNGLTALKNDKARVVSDFGAKIKKAEADVAIAANKIATGYEFRDVPVSITMNRPVTGKKVIIRDDTGERVGVEDMTEDEKQAKLIED